MRGPQLRHNDAMDLPRYRLLMAEPRDLAESGAHVTTNQLLVVFSTVVGEHRLGGDVGVLFRKLHDRYLSSSATAADVLDGLRALAALDDATLQQASGAKRLQARAPGVSAATS